MASLSTRLTLWSALVVTGTLTTALVAGGWLLRQQMIRGTELLQKAEFEEARALLGPETREFDATQLADHIRTHTELDTDLYYFQIHHATRPVLYRSANLGAAILPYQGESPPHWTAVAPPLGRLRISEFQAGAWHVQIASALAPVDRLLNDYTRVSLGLAGAIALVSLGLGYGFSRYALGPVRSLAHTAHRINADNLGERMVVPAGGGEIADLAQLLNLMFDRLEAAFGHARRFSANVSHELKTPLALIRLNAEKLRPRLAADSAAETQLDELLGETDRMHGLIERLLFIAKAGSGTLNLTLEPHDPAAVVGEFAEDARVLAEDSGVRFTLGRNEAGRVRCDPSLVRQLLLNLATNALRVTPPGGGIELTSALAGGRWRLELSDEGPGLPAEQLERAFEPFVRFGPAARDAEGRRGLGLGLAICRSIAETHHGRIHAEGRSDRSGLRLVVDLPAGE